LVFNFFFLRGVKNFSFAARLFARLSPEKNSSEFFA
jgi:hypothetical protein